MYFPPIKRTWLNIDTRKMGDKKRSVCRLTFNQAFCLLLWLVFNFTIGFGDKILIRLKKSFKRFLRSRRLKRPIKLFPLKLPHYFNKLNILKKEEEGEGGKNCLHCNGCALPLQKWIKMRKKIRLYNIESNAWLSL